LRINKKLSALILVLVLCASGLAGTAGALANSETAAQQIQPKAAQGATAQSAVALDAASDAGNAGLFVHEEAFLSDHSLTGLFDQCVKNFNTGDWAIKDAVVKLRYTATQLADNTLSSMTLTLNGQIFYSQRIEPSVNGETQELTVALPIDAITEGQNTLTIDTYVRTADSLPCVDDVSKANWMMIFKESIVSIQYLPQAPCDTVAQFYTQFTSIDALENRQSAVVIRPDADNAELTAAALILSGVSGQAQMFYDNMALETADDISNSLYRLYVSTYAELPAGLKNALSPEEQQAAQNNAVLALINGGGGSKLLLLTGSDDAALINAARLFGNDSYVTQLRKTWKSVSATDSVLMEKQETQQYLPLTETGTYLKGAFRQSASYYISFPENRLLAYSSQISLSMRYAENLDFDRSLVTVYINDEPVGSKKLEKDKAQGDTVVFDIPSDLNVSGNFSVRVSFDLEIKDLWCTLRQDETPWAWISEESLLKLSTVSADALIFQYYPSPFIKDGSFSDTVVVLPSAFGSADLEALREIMLTFGRYLTDNTGNLSVEKASDTSDFKGDNVISIGRYKNNLIAQQLNDKMYFRFSPEGTTLLSNEKMQIDPSYGASLGTVQLFNSPYGDDKRALMIVSGVSDEGMLLGAAYVGSTDNLWKIYGDGFVTDGEDVFPFRFKEDNAQQQTGLSQLLTRSDLRTVAIAAGLVVLLALTAVILLWRKYRRAGKEDKKQ